MAHLIAVSAHAASLGPLQGSYSLASHEQRDTVFVRGYVNGKLEREEVVTAEERDAVFGPLEKRQERKNRRRHRTARVRESVHLVGCSTAARHLLRLAPRQGIYASRCRGFARLPKIAVSHSNCEPSCWFPGQLPLVQSPLKDLVVVLHTLGRSPHCIVMYSSWKEHHADVTEP